MKDLRLLVVFALMTMSSSLFAYKKEKKRKHNEYMRCLKNTTNSAQQCNDKVYVEESSSAKTLKENKNKKPF